MAGSVPPESESGQPARRTTREEPRRNTPAESAWRFNIPAEESSRIWKDQFSLRAHRHGRLELRKISVWYMSAFRIFEEKAKRAPADSGSSPSARAVEAQNKMKAAKTTWASF